MVSLLNERSPLTRNEAGTIVCRSTCLVSQTVSARGSAELIVAGPLNVAPPDLGSKRPLSRTWVRPGARKSSVSICQAVSVGSQFTADALDRAAGKGKRLDAEP